MANSKSNNKVNFMLSFKPLIKFLMNILGCIIMGLILYFEGGFNPIDTIWGLSMVSVAGAIMALLGLGPIFNLRLRKLVISSHIDFESVDKRDYLILGIIGLIFLIIGVFDMFF